MNKYIDEMLRVYQAETIADKKNAMTEIIQEIVLSGLSRTDFFDKAAFYGGTALRIFYGLDRYSEDLDFSLLAKDDSFNLSQYFPAIQNHARAFGLNVRIEEKVKSNDSAIHSAFLKANTKEHLFVFYEDRRLSSSVAHNEIIRIKFEIDTCPSIGAGYEWKFKQLPSPYQIRIFNQSSLFAGKVHAVLCRNWKNRIKGRDLYDFDFYIRNRVPINLVYLENKLKESQFISQNKSLILDDLKSMLKEHFTRIDYDDAKNDVIHFVKEPDRIRLWCADYFIQITDAILCE